LNSGYLSGHFCFQEPDKPIPVVSMASLPQACSGAVKASFAYNSIIERWPKIITKVIDQMHQHHSEAVKKFGTVNIRTCLFNIILVYSRKETQMSST
jgi:hypothetical protein